MTSFEKRHNISYRPFMALFIAAALTFELVKIFAPGFSYSFIIKVIPALSLVAAILLTRPLVLPQKIAMLAATLFCGAGDIILDIDRVRFFVPGLAAFLLGHAGFIVFLAMRKEKIKERHIQITAAVLFAVVIAVLIFPRLGRLMVPVLAYLFVITIMTVTAIISDVKMMAVIGAVIFMLSDSMIALSKFVFNGQPSALYSIPVYFSGLFLLGFGILLTAQNKSVSDT